MRNTPGGYFEWAGSRLSDTWNSTWDSVSEPWRAGDVYGMVDQVAYAGTMIGLTVAGGKALPKAPKPAAKPGTAIVRYDPDFAVGQLTAGGRATASQLDEFGAAQGWARSQTATGPVKYTDGNGVVRLTIKQGSPRAPGSGGPHVELRNADGIRIDPFGNPVSRTSPGNHTPIVWDW